MSNYKNVMCPECGKYICACCGCCTNSDCPRSNCSTEQSKKANEN